MNFDSTSLLAVHDFHAISFDDLLSLHSKNIATAQAFCEKLKAATVNKTQKTKAKKQTKDIMFNVKYMNDKQMKEWLSKHPDHQNNLSDNSDSDDTSPEALLKLLDINREVIKIPVNLIADAFQEEIKPRRNRQKDRKLKKQQELEELQRQTAEETALMPDLKKNEAEALNYKCNKLGLTQQIIKADGHCLYYAVLDQLEQRHSKQHFSSYNLPKKFEFCNDPEGFYRNLNAKTLRNLNVSYLKANRELFELMVFDDNTNKLQDFDVYCEKMENSGAWGGEIELSVFSKIFGCKIFILQESTQYSIGDEEMASNPELKLIYYKHTFALGEHYGSLRDKNITS
ncbi:hypothetical protein QEN19_002808 [Hanseniaspora menglaensis]